MCMSANVPFRIFLGDQTATRVRANTNLLMKIDEMDKGFVVPHKMLDWTGIMCCVER